MLLFAYFCPKFCTKLTKMSDKKGFPITGSVPAGPATDLGDMKSFYI